MNNQSEDRVLGYVGTYPVGDYNAQTEYEYLNVVTHKGSSYVCIKEEGCIAVEPPNEECWQLFAGKGDTGEKGEKGDIGPIGPKPVNGVDYNTNAEREEFKNAVVADSKADLEKYITEKETHLDNYTKEKETKLDDYVTDTVKPVIDTYVTDTTKKDIDAYEKKKEKVLDTYTDTKKTEIDNYVTNTSKPALDKYEKDKEAELEIAKNTAISEYDAHAETLTNRIADLEEENSELVEQMPWNITEVQGSIHVDDAAKYSKNKLNVFGNLIQDETVTIPIDIKKSTKNNYISQSGALASSSITDTTDYIEVKPNKTYTVNLTANDTNFRNLVLFDSNKAVIEGKSYKGNSFSFTTTESACYVRFSYISTAKLTMSTEFDFNYPFMPVVATGLQKIKKYSKNLCKRFINGSMYRYSAAFYLDCNLEKGKYYALSFTDLSVGNVYYRNENVVGANGKYSSYTITSTGKRQTWIFLCEENNKNNGALYFKNKGYYFFKNNQQQEQQSNLVDVQLEEVTSLSSLATSYEPYKGEDIALDLGTTELCKITDQDGNVVAQDRAVYRKVDGVKKWQWEKNVYKDSLTNLNNRRPLIITSYLANNLYGIVFNSIEKHKMFGQVIAIVCDKLKAKFLGSGTNTTDTNSVRNVEGIALHSSNNNQICITLEKTRLESEDLEGVRNFIRVNNITFYYPILVPVYVDCTETQSAILDKLYRLSLEKGINNIFVESENEVTTELQLEYMQDNNLKKEQENKALEDRITAIENLLSTTETSALLLDNMQSDLEKEVK